MLQDQDMHVEGVVRTKSLHTELPDIALPLSTHRRKLRPSTNITRIRPEHYQPNTTKEDVATENRDCYYMNSLIMLYELFSHFHETE